MLHQFVTHGQSWAGQSWASVLTVQQILSGLFHALPAVFRTTPLPKA